MQEAHTYSFNITDEGSPSTMIIIEGVPFEREYDSGDFPNGPGSVSETMSFAHGNQHRALLDYQPSIGYRGFTTGTLQINYFTGMAQ